MINQLKTIQTNVSISEVSSIIEEMSVPETVKNEIFIHLRELQNSKKRPFVLVYNGTKGGYPEAAFSMMSVFDIIIEKTLEMQALRGINNGKDFRVVNFTDTVKKEVISWVFQANA